MLSVEGQAAVPVTEPQSSWFGPGGAIAVAAHYPLSPVVLIGLRLRAGLLSDGDQPGVAGVDDPGMGSFELASAMLRLRPFAKARDERLGTGLFLDLGAGGGVTGRSARPSVEAGLGYGFGLGALCLAPTVRYLQVVQPDEPPSADDARLLLAGIELTFNDRRPQPKAEPRIVEQPAPDRDGDGIEDASDGCPDEPEDLDGFQDTDGCPDPDNDADGVADKSDKCPDDAEDRDGFEDEDGCPEPDNDGDGIPDAEDECPNEAEVVNGLEDQDGCPDEGEIIFKDGRIVLEERVLFDFERARVKTRAKSKLNAIVALREQHPEWGDIHIEGHADARGNTHLNQHLSERRANNVRRALIELGVPASVLSSAGYGATRLRDHGNTEQSHQRNRRVEFVVETHTRVPATKPAPSPQGGVGLESGSPAAPPPLSHGADAPAQSDVLVVEPQPEHAPSAQPTPGAQHEAAGEPESEPEPEPEPQPDTPPHAVSAQVKVKASTAVGGVTGSRLAPQPEPQAPQKEAHAP